MSITARLADLRVTLPDAPAPAANYLPYVTIGKLVHVSGQLPNGPEGLVLGKLGDTLGAEAGAAAARLCAISLLSQVKAACGGDIERLVRVVKLTGFVNSTGEFADQPKVINGASDLMYEVFGDVGKHARSAVGVPVLPLDAAVEVDAIVALKA